MRLYSRLIITSVCGLMALTGTAGAFGSGEKTPEDKAAEASRKATSSYNDAVHDIDRAKEVAKRGDSTYAYNYRATSDSKARREYEKAVESLQEATKLNPKFKEAFNNLGYCYRKLGKLPESLAAYDKAIALDSNFAQAREYRGETYLALGQLSKAEDELAFLTSLKSDYADQLKNSIELYRLAEIDSAAHRK